MVKDQIKKDKYYFSEGDLRRYIKKSHLKTVEKFNEELEAWAKETGEEVATLYEDANTSFTLSNIRLTSQGEMLYDYDGKEDKEIVVEHDDDENCYYECEYDGIMDYIKFWRKCLHRAEKFWAMDPDHLDAIQNGEAEFHETEEED